MNEAKQPSPVAPAVPETPEQGARPVWRTPEITKVSLHQTFGTTSVVST